MRRLKLKKIPKREQKIKTLVVDGKWYAYRSRFSQGQSFLSHDDVKTGVYYGFFSSLLSLAKKLDTNKTIICWDFGDESVRRNEYPDYKRKRHSKPLTQYELDLNKQFKEEYHNLIGICKDTGFGGNYLIGYESDDLMAAYCLQNPNEEIYLATKDEDMFQCLCSHVIIYNNDDKIKKTDKWFKKEYGIEPNQWALVKSYSGCTSDNIPGIPNVGEVTAIKYLLGTATEKQMTKIKDNKELSDRWFPLVVLPHPDLQNDFVYGFTQSNLDIDKFIKFSQKLGFRQFLENLNDFKTYFMKK